MENEDKSLDAHIRIESYKQLGTDIYVDVFNSAIKDANEAHIVSEWFPCTDKGAEEATRFVQEHGFRVVVTMK